LKLVLFSTNRLFARLSPQEAHPQRTAKKWQTGDSTHEMPPAIVAPMKCLRLMTSCCAAAWLLAGPSLKADNAPATDTRYGLFNWLDHRSDYGQGVFPEPFMVDDSDLETGEFRLDWLNTAAGSAHSGIGTAEIEKGFGLLTLELEVPYEYDSAGGTATQGFDNLDLGARYPLFQFVSRSGLVDSTLGAGIEAGIPTTSDLSHNAELVPKIFDDLKVGRFTVQSILGYSMLFGPGEDGGLDTFEYGFVFGYTISHKTLPLPGVAQLIPVLELTGEKTLNKDRASQNSLTADIGLRANLKTIGRIQARPGIVFVFPMDNDAHAQTHWSIMTSLVFEF
jgi:hypothetical protein